jgi:hypothetical protein
MKRLFLLVALLISTSASADSLWHCIADNPADADPLVLLTSAHGLTVFNADGIQQFSLKLTDKGLNDEGTVRIYEAVEDNYLVLFLKDVGRNRAGFSIGNLDTNAFNLWVCK